MDDSERLYARDAAGGRRRSQTAPTLTDAATRARSLSSFASKSTTARRGMAKGTGASGKRVLGERGALGSAKTKKLWGAERKGSASGGSRGTVAAGPEEGVIDAAPNEEHMISANGQSAAEIARAAAAALVRKGSATRAGSAAQGQPSSVTEMEKQRKGSKGT